ncbi:MAG TPA: prolyl oligopeptidase family serine peptidase [Planctomycetota bacterium]|nr:prolyl oligopeptidase family serine peptidase [Planctomycetota bacterium]
MPNSEHRLVRPISKTVESNYLLHLPVSYGKSNTRWPLILFLHGAGERGNDLQKVREFGLARVCEYDPAFPFVVVSPQCPENDFWRNDVLLALLDEITETHSIDPDRIYLTGASMGGYGTWCLAAHEPQRFAAIAPLCGRAAGLWVWSLAQLPIWVFHGALDPVVPLRESQVMVDGLKALGCHVQFTVYKRCLHDCWTRTYRNQKLYDWFLSHKRAAIPKSTL